MLEALDLDEATTVRTRKTLEDIASEEMSEQDEAERWQWIKAKAPQFWEKAWPILVQLILPTMRQEMGL